MGKFSPTFVPQPVFTDWGRVANSALGAFDSVQRNARENEAQRRAQQYTDFLIQQGKTEQASRQAAQDLDYLQKGIDPGVSQDPQKRALWDAVGADQPPTPRLSATVTGGPGPAPLPMRPMNAPSPINASASFADHFMGNVAANGAPVAPTPPPVADPMNPAGGPQAQAYTASLRGNPQALAQASQPPAPPQLPRGIAPTPRPAVPAPFGIDQETGTGGTPSPGLMPRPVASPTTDQAPPMQQGPVIRPQGPPAPAPDASSPLDQIAQRIQQVRAQRVDGKYGASVSYASTPQGQAELQSLALAQTQAQTQHAVQLYLSTGNPIALAAVEHGPEILKSLGENIPQLKAMLTRAGKTPEEIDQIVATTRHLNTESDLAPVNATSQRMTAGAAVSNAATERFKAMHPSMNAENTVLDYTKLDANGKPTVTFQGTPKPTARQEAASMQLGAFDDAYNRINDLSRQGVQADPVAVAKILKAIKPASGMIDEVFSQLLAQPDSPEKEVALAHVQAAMARLSATGGNRSASMLIPQILTRVYSPETLGVDRKSLYGAAGKEIPADPNAPPPEGQGWRVRRTP